MINPKNRVSQLDSRLLDNELFELLYQTLIDCFNVKNLPKRISDLKVKNNDELKLILKLILFKLTIYDKNSSYGLILSRLVMADADTNKNHNKLSLKKKYILLSLLVGEYLFKKLESLIYRDDFQEQDTDVTNDKISRLQKLSLKMFIGVIKFDDF
ncbi:hypothetical protein PACTADRAFT_31152 [Pachysolen tannophilus NRRL Y-2460]|uniref:Pex N-terminal domain-containing protein n=1 Tax=Pachysolen tannophilus NRRL Y-2460 TaxID=669874 RepID=A0A1E4U133_PACTA|nr:hypothetical protein PACTADRAFT_31152 [Pachysolen tannophilus NRRL Y-2460]